MKINGKEYGFTVIPNEIYVVAEIYEVYETKHGNIHIGKLSKEFGSFFRKPKEEDYIKANNWAHSQLNYIFNANK
jgi:hypothetical protein